MPEPRELTVVHTLLPGLHHRLHQVLKVRNLNEMRHAGKQTDTQTDQLTDIKEFSDTDGHTDIYIDRHIYTGGQTGI